MRHLFVAACTTAILAAPLGAADAWRPLFDGRNLDGWVAVQRHGTVHRRGRRHRRPRPSSESPNSFLCTQETFGDFILEYEARIDVDLNSGVQIRSISDPAIKNGRVHGYQVEIDPSARAWTGGIYDEARRGWLHTLDRSDSARSRRSAGRRGTGSAWRRSAVHQDVGERRRLRRHPRRPHAARHHRAPGARIGNDASKAGQAITLPQHPHPDRRIWQRHRTPADERHAAVQLHPEHHQRARDARRLDAALGRQDDRGLARREARSLSRPPAGRSRTAC